MNLNKYPEAENKICNFIMCDKSHPNKKLSVNGQLTRRPVLHSMDQLMAPTSTVEGTHRRRPPLQLIRTGFSPSRLPV